MLRPTVNLNARAPLICWRMPMNTKQTALIIFACRPHVLFIRCPRDITKIRDSVVSAIAVDMVNLIRRP